MKKNLIITAIASIGIILGFISYKPMKMMLTEKPVEKTIAYQVYRAANYSSEAYNQTSAQVHIIVEKVSKHTRTIVWEKTMDAQLLKQYPTLNNAAYEKIHIPGIVDRKEHLEVKYVLTYDSKGSQLEMQSGTVVSAGAKTGKLEIGI